MTDDKAIKAIMRRHRDKDALQLERDVKAVLSTPAGRRLFMAIAMQGGVYHHSRPDTDHVYTAGRRDAALELMAVANAHAPELVLKARQERHDLVSARNAEIMNKQNKNKENQ